MEQSISTVKKRLAFALTIKRAILQLSSAKSISRRATRTRMSARMYSLVVIFMDSSVIQKNIEALSMQLLDKVEGDWQTRKIEEVVDCHDALITASQNYPRVVVLSALQLFNHELIEEIISEITVAIQKREQLRALAAASADTQKKETSKIEETLNP
jgi:hypothetical protein